MSNRIEEQDAEYRDAITSSMLAAIAIHLFVAVLGGAVFGNLWRSSDENFEIGYEGPTRVLDELEIIEPNSVQAWFHQRMQVGRMQAPEYQIIDPLDLEPGPEPIPVRQLEKKPAPQISDFPEEVELIEPLKAYHKEVSFSQDYKLLKASLPDYPHYEEQRAIGAQVVLWFYLSPEGNIEDERITEVVTNPVGASPKAFELAVLEAVRQWRILPPMRQGQPQGRWMGFRIDFIAGEGVMVR